MAKHSVENATALAEAGALATFIFCLEDPNVAIKEMATCGVGCLISKSPLLASQAIESGAVQLLLACFQCNELQLKNIAAQAMGDLAAHSASHARSVVDSMALMHFARALNNIDVKLKVCVCAYCENVIEESF